MRRSKKLIVGVVLAAVLLFGSLGGVALAADNGDDSQPDSRCGALLDRVCEIYGKNTGVTLDSEALKDAFTQAQSEMRPEYIPEGRPHSAPMRQVFENLGYDQEAVQTAFEQARTELEGGTLEGGRGAVMARMLEILGIDEQDWQAACAEIRQAYQEMRSEKPEGGPFGLGFGFKGHGGFRGMPGTCGWGEPGPTP